MIVEKWAGSSSFLLIHNLSVELFYIRAACECTCHAQHNILSHHGKYTAFPADHFKLLRTTPPKSIPDKTELRFFDILYNEKPYKKEQTRFVHRIKKNFLLLVGGQGVVEDRHKERLAIRIETIYAPKAINMGALKNFAKDVNREGLEIYILEYEEHEKLEALLNSRIKRNSSHMIFT